MSLLPRDVIRRALRLTGRVASNTDPTADEMTDAILAANTMKRALFGTLIGPRLSTQWASGSAAQAEVGGEYMIPAATFTLTAPASPRGGDRFGVVDANLNFAVDPCTIQRNGALLNGQAASLVLSAPGAHLRFWYRPDQANWIEEADWPALTTPIEFPDSLIAYLPYMLSVVIAPEFGDDPRSDIVAGAVEGRAAFARAFGRRGARAIDPPLGLAPLAPAAPQPAQG